jgi:hypothetical protein
MAAHGGAVAVLWQCCGGCPWSQIHLYKLCWLTPMRAETSTIL